MGSRPKDEAMVGGVVVLGDASCILHAVFPAVPVLRLDLERVNEWAGSPAVLVLDACNHPLSALAGARAKFSGAAVLVIAGDDGEGTPEALHADDVASPRCPPRDLERKLRLLLELGRARLALTKVEDMQREAERLRSGLAEREAFDHAVLDGIDAGIITTDAEGRVNYTNRSASDVLRLQGDARGADVSRLLHLGSDPHTLLGKELRRRLTHTFLRSDGMELELELAISRAEDASHEDIGFIVILRDVTAERQADAERRRFQHLASMGIMVAGFAHEVLNPLASLRSLAEALNDELVEAKVTFPHVGHIFKVLQRVERLVDTLLQFGRPAPPQRARHRPTAILCGVASALHPRVREMGGELRIEAEPDLPDVYVDESQLVQVLVILLNNALDATGTTKRVLLRAMHGASSEPDLRSRKSQPPADASGVRFDVIDDGPGISPEILGRIFDPFFTTKASGTGLGLSIAQQLVHENGGRLEVATAAGGPTTFSVFVGSSLDVPSRFAT